MKRRLLTFAAAAALVALTATGCGSSKPATPGASGEAAGLTLQQVKDAGVLTIGTEGTYKPFSFHEGGTGPLTVTTSKSPRPWRTSWA